MSNLLGLGYAGGDDDDEDEVDDTSGQSDEHSPPGADAADRRAATAQPVGPSDAATQSPILNSDAAAEIDARKARQTETDAQPAAAVKEDDDGKQADDGAAERSDGDAGQRPRDSATDTAARASTSVPPAPPEPCRPSLQARIDLLLQQQARSGKQLISTLLHNREYRNPRFMERLVELNNVQQYGTCFAPAVFDPASLPEEDYLPQIRRRLEKQRQEKKAAREKLASQGIAAALGAPRMHPAAVPAAASAPATFLQRVSGTSSSKPASDRKRSRRWDNTQPRSPRR